MGDFGLARRTPAQRPAFVQQTRTRGAVDSAVDASATQERAVGSVDDAVDFEFGQVAGDMADGVVERLGGGGNARGEGGREVFEAVEQRDGGNFGEGDN